MRFITRLVEERPRHLEWVQYPVQNLIISYASLGLWEANWKLGWVGGRSCAVVCENTRGNSWLGLFFPLGLLHVSGSFLGVCVVALESYQSNFLRTLPEQLPGWPGGWQVCPTAGSSSTTSCWGAHVQNSNSFPSTGLIQSFVPKFCVALRYSIGLSGPLVRCVDVALI